ncbi:hypothetical protein [Actinomadura rubrisoli]|uniref:Uncharacterized protein n=1 Tax=Actinomadura rubrisoli TaxID=2530368 RepID=A0A4R5CFZ5_9ACTN|nr:hypothetical protein [Actinomadura rubrisoli]TDD97203.1 hypothetical protein E1298_01840 [Actinomadura rubrisoli]
MMDNVTRIGTYTRNRRSMTAPQRRRFVKKALRSQRPSGMDGRRRVEMALWILTQEEERKVNECKKCDAYGDNPCVTGSGQKAKTNHKGRGVVLAA